MLSMLLKEALLDNLDFTKHFLNSEQFLTTKHSTDNYLFEQWFICISLNQLA